jgi:hypothetical protein
MLTAVELCCTPKYFNELQLAGKHRTEYYFLVRLLEQSVSERYSWGLLVSEHFQTSLRQVNKLTQKFFYFLTIDQLRIDLSAGL